jgi:hypothetical protein
VRITRGYATPATRGSPPFALENSLTDTEMKTPKKKKKKNKKKFRASPGNARKLLGRTDRHRKQNPQTTKQKKKKKKKKVCAGPGSARKLSGQFTTNRLASSVDHI